ncbi:MAG: hypothetical protein E6J42_02825 [Chloroflexi bacterium]|nr:MAG: hypothetical protein E6J42_02825 [Chloroflexota bacterium]
MKGQGVRVLLAAYAGALAILGAGAVVGGVLLYDASGPSDAAEAAADEHTYNFATWELQHFPHKWVYWLRHLSSGHSGDEQEQSIHRYFQLTDEIAGLTQERTDPERLAASEAERAGLRADVEHTIEGRITGILEDQGLAMRPPLFGDLGLIFPPVDFELDAPPRVLAISPRDRIELDRSFALEPGLNVEAVSAIERQAESANRGEQGVSALVVGLGGIATYPSIVSGDDSYSQMIDTAFHEWTHQYLVFFPLGRSYFSGGETRTLNESVAQVSGHELARLYFQKYPAVQQSSVSPQPGFDITGEMRALRREVESLLSEQKVTDAEALMATKRDEFAAKGYYIRRLNQAYFAFHGSYADSPASIDPIGPELQLLLVQSGSPGSFLRAAAGVTTRSELESLLGQ